MKINKTKTAKEIDPAKKANLRKFVTGINEGDILAALRKQESL